MGKGRKRDRHIAFSIGFAVIVAATTGAFSSELKDPLSALTSEKGSVLCFRRDYSPEHLAQHPAQTIKSVVLAFQEQGLVDVVLSPRTGAPKRIGAGCEWRQGAGIDTSDRKMIPSFNKAAGFDCMATVGDSAEERGYLLIDPSQDAKSVTVFLQSPIGVDDGNSAEGSSLTLGPEDRIFALTRIDSTACERFKAKDD